MIYNCLAYNIFTDYINGKIDTESEMERQSEGEKERAVQNFRLWSYYI